MVGEDHQGRGCIATWSEPRGRLEYWPIDSAPLRAATIDSRGALYAVGDGGFAFRQEVGHPQLERVLTHRHISAIAVDPAECVWGAALGRIVMRPDDGSATWRPVWTSAEPQGRFVSLAAFAGMVLAATDDGQVVVGRQL
jgi:hypothetical protein